MGSGRHYVCTACGHASAKWFGRCPTCGAWGSLVEESDAAARPKAHPRGAVRLHGLGDEAEERLHTGSGELDRVLGGGLVPGAAVLLAGDPGIGKSTLALLVAGRVAERLPVLYVAGEESEREVARRAKRLGCLSEQLWVTADTSVEAVLEEAGRIGPGLLVVDSIQTVHREELSQAPGTPTQVREAAQAFVQFARGKHAAVLMIGQVTKDSSLAGPRLLEHMVDVVLTFEGERGRALRALRAVKNRFGSTEEIALFAMEDGGLAEIANPSRYLMAERTEPIPGAVVVATARGSRPLFTELQALVSEVPEGIPPRHQAVGVARQRLELVAAVLQRWTPYRIAFRNAFVSLAGGFDSDDPALDLGILVALASSAAALPVPTATLFVGEVTLAGEVRSVPDLSRLLAEAERLSLRTVVAPAFGPQARPRAQPRLVPVRTVHEALAWLGNERGGGGGRDG